MARFKPGDVCVVVRSALEEFPPGCEVTIAEVREDNPQGLGIYRIDETIHGCPVWASDACLRPKRPPEHPDTVSTWDACPWRPGISVREEPRFVSPPSTIPA